MQRGDSFLLAARPQQWLHLWIVATEPLPATTETVVVSVTTLRNAADQTVVLRKGDHPFIQHDSVVRYGSAQIFLGSKIDSEIETGATKSHARCTEDLIDEIEEGLWASPFTPNKILRFMEEHL